ncbi:ERG4/ERG24 ergosterol biosynthesis protein [Mycena floridula]|nr:ERG4/ERG24 ergosterol biosynthesis protein [Mycena floridula]
MFPKKQTKNNILNPKSTSYEFLGPPGTLFITVAVPITIYALYFGCSEETGGCPPSTDLDYLKTSIKQALSDENWWKNLWDTQAALIYLAWYAFCLLSWVILPGEWIEGVTMRTGEKKKYKMNALPTFLLAVGVTSGYICRYGPQSLSFVYEKWVGFITASLAMSVVQAILVYAMSFQEGKQLALGGNTGNVIYDFFIGRELNPSIGSFDIKTFNELRPGLILWVLIDIAMACEQASRRGGRLESITDSMWLVLAFQGWYVADSIYHEPAVLTTMDVTTDGFGFMLSVGDLALVPIVYSLQARYLVFNQIELGPLLTAAVFLTNLTGYYIFRAANGEKNDFRNGKNHKNLSFFVTASGSKLITSGWWGRSRHPNYFGDIIMALAWSLPTGFNTPITYFYVIYFAVLLIHRQRRDDENCEKKYGNDWHKYKQMVPYRIIPYIY